MTIVGYGPARPAARNPKGRDRNRRVEIRFVTQPENVVRASNSAAP